jgi:hypothetical protein
MKITLTRYGKEANINSLCYRHPPDGSITTVTRHDAVPTRNRNHVAGLEPQSPALAIPFLLSHVFGANRLGIELSFGYCLVR